MSINSSVSELNRLGGLRSAKAAIASLARGDSPVHAVLLYGAEGAGTLPLCRILAKSWLCTNPGPEGACGECRACGAFDRGRCADYQEFEPWGPSRILKLNAIREVSPADEDFTGIPLIPFFNTPTLMARTKVVALVDAERLNDKANSALLKTLEEPPPYGRIILTTSSISRIPATILSRCLALACELPEVAEDEMGGSGWLLAGGAPGTHARIEANPEVYRALAEFASGLPDLKPAVALARSDQFRDLCAELAKVENMNARAAQAEGLNLLSAALLRLGAPPEWVQRVADAHRRIQGNAGVGPVFDSLFCGLANPNSGNWSPGRNSSEPVPRN